MGFRFRKSIKIGPARVNLSKSGIGYSVGTKGFRVTKKAGGGTRTTASIPGTGISYSTSSGSKKSSRKTSAVKPSASSGNYSSASSGSFCRDCLTAFLWVIGIMGVITLIEDYWWLLLIIGALVGAVFLIRYFARKNQALDQPAEPEEAPATPSKPEFLAKDISVPVAPPRSKPATPKDSSFSANEISAPTAPPETKPATPVEPEENKEPSFEDVFQTRKAAAIAKFSGGLESIPVNPLPASAPVPRQLLKDLPPYNFSNVTRKTRLDSIFPLVVLDVETTGVKPSGDEIIEIAAIKFDTGMVPVDAFTTFCKPKKAIPAEATAVNHISDDMVQNAPRFAEIAPAVTDFLKGCHLVGHNLDFDLRFIHASGAKLPDGTRFYDTLDLAHLTVPSGYVWDYKLDTLCHHYQIWREEGHRSLSDCYATAQLFAALVKDKTGRQLISDPDSAYSI